VGRGVDSGEHLPFGGFGDKVGQGRRLAGGEADPRAERATSMLTCAEANALASQGLHQSSPPLPGVVASDHDVVRLEDRVLFHAE
jgi:hypothetical protein